MFNVTEKIIYNGKEELNHKVFENENYSRCYNYVKSKILVFINDILETKEVETFSINNELLEKGIKYIIKDSYIDNGNKMTEEIILLIEEND